MATPGTSLKESQSIADWLPLLGSIVQALSGMAEDDRAEDDRIAERSPAAAREVDTRSNETAR